MAAPGQGRGISLPLLLLCLGLGYVVYFAVNAELPVPAGAPVATAAPEAAPELPLEAEFEMRPLETFSETLERPLFMATRRPPEPQPEVDAPPPARPEAVGMELNGIVISPTGRRALLRPLKSREVVRATEGQVIEGWTVQSILPDRVILQRDGVSEELRLVDKAVAAAAKRRQREKERQQRSGTEGGQETPRVRQPKTDEPAEVKPREPAPN